MMKRTTTVLRNLWHGYRSTAVLLLNTMVVLVLLNGALGAVFWFKDRRARNPVSAQYGHAMVRAAYPELSENEMDLLLQETWARPYSYEPFTQFKEPAFEGRYVNVDANGFRITKNQGSWPPDSAGLNIFLFGGSTAFGYGVSDEQTLASYLQEILAAELGQDVHIYNFARGYYYSTQERILYQELLVAGLVPDLALFVDGLNDFYHGANEPLFTQRFRDLVAKETTSSIKSLALATSLGRAVRGFGRKLSRQAASTAVAGAPADADGEVGANARMIEEVVDRYLANKKLIEAVSVPYGVTPVFVWQPVPTHRYNLAYHPFAEGGFAGHGASEHGYSYMARWVEEHPLGDNFFWCADIQEGEKEALYVDKVHYSAAFTEALAARIAALLLGRFPSVFAPLSPKMVED